MKKLFTIILVILSILLVLYFNYRIDKKFMDSCTKYHSYDYCMNKR